MSILSCYHLNKGRKVPERTFSNLAGSRCHKPTFLRLERAAPVIPAISSTMKSYFCTNKPNKRCDVSKALCKKSAGFDHCQMFLQS